MYKYTICFIRQGQKLLMLNREKSDWMGVWNGVGGKLEKGETPLECIRREIKEETGIELEIEAITYKGDVTWTDPERTYKGGMYVFIAELPETYMYPTPIKTEEGILDWKELSWILHPDNYGIANLKYYLSVLFEDENIYEHSFVYDGHTAVEFETVPLEQHVSK